MRYCACDAFTEVNDQRVRAVQDAARWKRQAEKWYERNRLLENAIRNSYRSEKQHSAVYVLEGLLRRIPLNPRVKFGRKPKVKS